jgi:predicted amidophosphoribosyltransferase
MAESAGRYCPLCGEAAGLQDRICRRCGESLQVPGRDMGMPPSTSSQEGPEEEAREGRETGSRRHWWRRLFGE